MPAWAAEGSADSPGTFGLKALCLIPDNPTRGLDTHQGTVTLFDGQTDAVVIPLGGGGLTVGIAGAVKALRPQTKIFTAEPETGAALHAALRAGAPTEVDYQASFVDGSGSRRVLDTMWPRLAKLAEILSAPAPGYRSDGGGS